MDVSKPDVMTIRCCPITWLARYQLSITMLAYFCFDAPHRLLSETALLENWPKLAPPSLSMDDVYPLPATHCYFYGKTPAWIRPRSIAARQTGFLLGTETIEIGVGALGQPERISRLPGLRPRCFLQIRTAAGITVRELDAPLEKIWLFPDSGQGVLRYRAVTPLPSHDARQATHLLAEWERFDQPTLPSELYLERWQGLAKV